MAHVISTNSTGRTFFGTTGNDELRGTEGDDVFVFSGSGSTLGPGDLVRGGDGFDRLYLQSDDVSVPMLYAGLFGGIEEIVFLPATDRRYGFTGAHISAGFVLGQGVLGGADTLRIDASGLADGDRAYVENTGDGALIYRAGGGTDVVRGGTGDDVFLFDRTSFGINDQLNGGAGSNRLALKGDHVASFGGEMLLNIQQIELLGRDDTRYGAAASTVPGSYRLTFADPVSYYRPLELRVNGASLGADETMYIDASRISTQIVNVTGGAGNDTVLLGTDDDIVSTGKGNDYVSIASGGVDTVDTGEGDDIVYAGDRLDDGDRLHLGTGYDRLQLRGNYDILFDNGSTGLAISGLDQIDLMAGLPPAAGGAAAGLTYRIAFNSSWNYDTINARDIVIDARLLTSADSTLVQGPAYEGLTYLGGGAVADVRGGTRDDTFYFGEQGYAAGNRLKGFDGLDRLKLQGDHSIVVGDRIEGIDRIELMSHLDTSYGGGRAGGYTYTITYDRTASASIAPPVIFGHTLAAEDRMTVDAMRYGGQLTVFGGAGADRLIGGTNNDDVFAGGGDDFISIAAGGGDVVDAGAGNDGVYVGAAYGGDTIRGGAGNDQLAFQGYYTGTTLANITGFETIVFLSGYDMRFENPLFQGSYYDMIAPDALVVAGGRMIVTTNQLTDNEYAKFDASAETDASYVFFGGKGGDGFTGGAQSDGFYFGAGAFNHNDVVRGGDGADDQLGLQGDYSVVLNSTNMQGIETLVLLSATVSSLGGGSGEPFSYDVAMAELRYDDTATALTVNANTLQANENLRFDASQNTRVAYTVYGGLGIDIVTGGAKDDRLFGGGSNDVLFGGKGRDTLNGGDGDDELVGGLGADILTGGAGSDVFSFTDHSASSIGAAYDIITDFDAAHDRIAINRDEFTHRGDDVTGVRLEANNFDGWLTEALFEKLDLGEVTIVRASSGSLAGHVFLVADQNGVAGYQAGEDLVIELGGGITTLPADLGWLAP